MQATTFKEGLFVALEENLLVAKFCLLHKKDENSDNYEDGDVFGFPAAILLLNIIDTIGGYSIKENGWNHFNILNGEIFENQKLLPTEVKDLYNAFRDPLIHNNILLRGFHCSPDGGVFSKVGNKVDSINLSKLCDLCERAIGRFKETITEDTINNKLKNKINNLFSPFDRNNLPPGLDSQITKQIELLNIPISGTINTDDLKKIG